MLKKGGLKLNNVIREDIIITIAFYIERVFAHEFMLKIRRTG